MTCIYCRLRHQTLVSRHVLDWLVHDLRDFMMDFHATSYPEPG